MSRLRFCLGLVLVLSSVSVALAQRPPGGGPGGPRGGGFGFGGFGGFGGGPGAAPSLLMLAGAEAVQKELGLKEDQISKIKSLNEDAAKEMRSVFGEGGFGDRQKESDQEREKRREEARTKMMAAQKKVNETIIPKLNEALEAPQRERLQQIRLQVWGSMALLDAEVGKSLSLTKEQSDKLAAIGKDFGEKQAGLFQRNEGNNDRGDFQERFAKMRELSEARDKQFTDVLMSEQREKLESLKGKAFDVAQLRGGFGGRGFGGPGGQNPGGGRPRRPAAEEKKSDN